MGFSWFYLFTNAGFARKMPNARGKRPEERVLRKTWRRFSKCICWDFA